MTNTSVTTMSTAGTRPTHRSSQVVGGERTNASSAASAMGTNTACAQYRTTITRTTPPKITQCLNEFDGSSILLGNVPSLLSPAPSVPSAASAAGAVILVWMRATLLVKTLG